MSEKIRAALADPDAPWYGSDLVPLVADELDRLEQIESLARQLCTDKDSGYDALGGDSYDQLVLKLAEPRP